VNRLARIASALAVLLTLATHPGRATAADEGEARQHFTRGQELFKQKRFLEAAREFEAGFVASPRPLFLLNIGHSYRRAEEFRKAKAAYEMLLRVEPNTPYRKEVLSLIATIDDALEGSRPLPPQPKPAAPPAPPAAPAPPASPVVPTVRKASTPAPPPPAPTRALQPAPRVPVGPPPARPQSSTAFDPLHLAAKPDEQPPSSPPSAWKSPWLWGAVGSALVAGAVIAVMAASGGKSCTATLCLMEH
jgi:hypothetical protein